MANEIPQQSSGKEFAKYYHPGKKESILPPKVVYFLLASGAVYALIKVGEVLSSQVGNILIDKSLFQ